MPQLSLPILQDIAYRHHWANGSPSGSDSPLLLFTGHRHLGTLRLAFDGDFALRLTLDLACPETLASAFPGWPIEGGKRTDSGKKGRNDGHLGRHDANVANHSYDEAKLQETYVNYGIRTNQ